MNRYLFIISVFILNSLCASSQDISVAKFEDDHATIAQMNLAICGNQFQKMVNDFNELYLNTCDAISIATIAIAIIIFAQSFTAIRLYNLLVAVRQMHNPKNK